MQIIISIKVLAALADIADGANGNKYSNKICFMPGYKDVVATNGHILAVVHDSSCEMYGNVIVAMSSKRAKVIINEAKGLPTVKALGTVMLFDNEEEYSAYIKDQKETPACLPHAAFLFVPSYDYVSVDGINKYLKEEQREADTFIPSYNIKYQKRAAKLWCAVSGFRNEDDPQYDSVYIGKSNTLHVLREDNRRGMHAVIMPYSLIR